MLTQSLHRVPALDYVEIETPRGCVVARSDERYSVGSADVLGWLRARRLCRDYRMPPAPVVEVLVEPFRDDWPPALLDMRWPFPSDVPLEDSFWENGDSAHLRQLVADEARQVDALTSYLSSQLPPDSHVLEVGCSHGSLLASLANVRPDLRLFGMDRSLLMVQQARFRAPAAEVWKGDARALGEGSFDAVVTRALAIQVMTRTDALTALSEAVRVTKPGGYVVVHSLMPPLVGREDLVAAGGSVERTTRRDRRDRIKPFYVLRCGNG
jgi:SAM-dependent methyltransferase